MLLRVCHTENPHHSPLYFKQMQLVLLHTQSCSASCRYIYIRVSTVVHAGVEQVMALTGPFTCISK